MHGDMFWWRKIRISGSTGRENPENRVFWSTYRESSYHTFDNSVVRHIRCLPRNLNGIYSSQMVKRSMWEPFWNGRLNGLIQLVSNKIGRQTFKISENWESENWSKKTSKNWNIKKIGSIQMNEATETLVKRVNLSGHMPTVIDTKF